VNITEVFELKNDIRNRKEVNKKEMETRKKEGKED
jgi:hypothetical protein